jgi:hypothetical protein
MTFLEYYTKQEIITIIDWHKGGKRKGRFPLQAYRTET